MKLNDWIFKWQDKNSGKAGPEAFVLAILLFIGVFNALICNDKPLILRTEKAWYFPAFGDFWHDLTLQPRKESNLPAGEEIHTLIPYSYTSIDRKNMAAVSPFEPQNVPNRRYRHWLGTDQIGRDVAAGISRSLYNSVRVALLATLISLFIGTFLGMLAGVAGDRRLHLGIAKFVSLSLTFVLFLFYALVSLRGGTLIDHVLMILFLVLFGAIQRYLPDWGRKKIYLPVNSGVSTLIELRKSLPGLFWILLIVSIFRQEGLLATVLIIGLTAWTNFARVSRAEAMSMSAGNFIAYSEALGLGVFRIMFRHILPNIRPLLVTLALFAFTSNILLETSLSFLGLGLPPEELSFGSFFASSIKNIRAWWLIVFPGLVFFILVFCLRILGGHASEEH